MSKFIINEKKAFADLTRIMRSWNLSDNPEKLIDELLEQMIQSSWNRKRIYDFIFIYTKNNLTDSDYSAIPEVAFDYLNGVETSIIGYCSYDSFLKFPDEPQDPNELIAYVREEKWKR